MSKKLLKYFLVVSFSLSVILSVPELLYKNRGMSHSGGSVGNGNLSNPYLIPFFGKNYRYFSLISYFLMDNAYVHSSVYKTVKDSYAKMYKVQPEKNFIIMECSDKKGGKLRLHKTHQNGLSIDFMSPKKTKRFHPKWNNLGLMHYLLEFDDTGKLKFDKNVEIDFDLMAQHILSLQSTGQRHGVRIKKVILKIELKDELFNSKFGQALKKSGIYFAQSLPKWTNKMHDDHYHIDFEIYK